MDRACRAGGFGRVIGAARIRASERRPGGATGMTRAAHSTSRLAYPVTLGMMGLALAFPIALMIFDPTLMFERGWEQYVGTAIYAWAVLTLGNELFRLWSNEKAFDEA